MDNPTTPDVAQAAPNVQPGSRTRMPRISRWRRMQIPVIAWVVYWLVRLIGPTLRFEYLGKRNVKNLPETGQATIGAFWHRCIFPTLWYFRNHGIVVMITMNFDGLWASRVVEKFGYRVAQGSSSRGGMNALKAMAQEVEAGWVVAFTPDGPRGPRYVAKPGPVILARRTGKSITIFHIGLSSAYTFEKSWDHFRLPFPFSRAVLVVAPPIYVSKDAGSEEMQQKISEMQTALERVRDVAESWFQLSETERQRLRREWNEERVGAPALGVSS